MVIDLRNQRLININTIELNKTETKIIALLSDNAYHNIDEIMAYTQNRNSPKVLNELIDKYDFLLHFSKKRGTGYRIQEKIYIK